MQARRQAWQPLTLTFSSTESALLTTKVAPHDEQKTGGWLLGFLRERFGIFGLTQF